MDEQRRNLFAEFVLQCRGLSKCREPKAVVIVGSCQRLISIGYNVQVVEGFIQEPVILALQSGIANPRYAFLTYFPHYEELLLLLSNGIRSINFWGEVDDQRTAEFLNTYNIENSTSITDPAIEIINLKK